jgi:3-dehydroquinate synthase
MSDIISTVPVELGDRSYHIDIGKGWQDELPARLGQCSAPCQCVIVTNPEIGGILGESIHAALSQSGYDVSICELSAGEEHKTIDAVTRIHDFMLERRFTRQSILFALGGGVVGDIAGFAAASLLRGIHYIQMPTSLLAMVDSSVGGKTGVNHAMGKNLVGAFWQPVWVAIDLEWLDTLPDGELRAGLAEVIKYGVIADAGLFEYLETHVDDLLARRPEALTHIIRLSCEIKARVVSADEREQGLRAILNFGHTFCHAAEALSGYSRIRHGEGVAMGMVAAARLAAARGMISDGIADRIENLCRSFGLPVRMLKYDPGQYWKAMGSDKKVRDSKIRFILPTGLGKVEILDDVRESEVIECLNRTMAS